MAKNQYGPTTIQDGIETGIETSVKPNSKLQYIHRMMKVFGDTALQYLPTLPRGKTVVLSSFLALAGCQLGGPDTKKVEEAQASSSLQAQLSLEQQSALIADFLRQHPDFKITEQDIKSLTQAPPPLEGVVRPGQENNYSSIDINQKIQQAETDFDSLFSSLLQARQFDEDYTSRGAQQLLDMKQNHPEQYKQLKQAIINYLKFIKELQDKKDGSYYIVDKDGNVNLALLERYTMDSMTIIKNTDKSLDTKQQLLSQSDLYYLLVATSNRLQPIDAKRPELKKETLDKMGINPSPDGNGSYYIPTITPELLTQLEKFGLGSTTKYVEDLGEEGKNFLKAYTEYYNTNYGFLADSSEKAQEAINIESAKFQQLPQTIKQELLAEYGRTNTFSSDLEDYLTIAITSQSMKNALEKAKNGEVVMYEDPDATILAKVNTKNPGAIEKLTGGVDMVGLLKMPEEIKVAQEEVIKTTTARANKAEARAKKINQEADVIGHQADVIEKENKKLTAEVKEIKRRNEQMEALLGEMNKGNNALKNIAHNMNH